MMNANSRLYLFNWIKIRKRKQLCSALLLSQKLQKKTLAAFISSNKWHKLFTVWVVFFYWRNRYVRLGKLNVRKKMFKEQLIWPRPPYSWRSKLKINNVFRIRRIVSYYYETDILVNGSFCSKYDRWKQSSYVIRFNNIS